MSARSPLPYAAFTRHLTSPGSEAPEPQPLDPEKRVTAELIDSLARIERTLTEAQIDMLTLYPETVRLALSRQLLATAERVHKTADTLKTWQRFGTLTPPRSAPPTRRKRFKP